MLAHDEYEKLASLLSNDDISKNEAYSDLMKKEENVLNILNRISKAKVKEQKQETDFTKVSLENLAYNLYKVGKDIFHELILFSSKEELSVNDFIQIFIGNDRLFYVGFMIVLLSLVLFFIDVSK